MGGETCMKRYIVTRRSVIEDCGVYEANSEKEALEMFDDDLHWGTDVVSTAKIKVKVYKGTGKAKTRKDLTENY
jgi:hypothetical protein